MSYRSFILTLLVMLFLLHAGTCLKLNIDVTSSLLLMFYWSSYMIKDYSIKISENVWNYVKLAVNITEVHCTSFETKLIVISMETLKQLVQL